jgi:2-polyprenyl-3-methyl-5-hydroxy-6-metoxy-1,4-benzoquinol methylase
MNMSNTTELIDQPELYELDEKNRDQLMISAPMMRDWSRTVCASKSTGGMEEWAKVQNGSAGEAALTCDWYHGTWQFLRLLNMVAVPPWYEFYNEALSKVLLEKPTANVLISAAADYGMLCTLHEAVTTAGADPTITLYDICNTPLRASQWYAERHGLQLTCICDNLLTSPNVPLGAFDLVVTDEFLTVLKNPDKPQIVERWKQFLKPGGVVVTTAMMGGVTTPELRKSYADKARTLLDRDLDLFRTAGESREELVQRFEYFAGRHTRHMVTDEQEVRSLFADLRLERLTPTATPGECVNPTTSFQIVAVKP